jgi:hypothetical protein
VIAYELQCEFDITRRIGWSDEALGEHIDAVFDRLHQAKGVLSIDASADLDTGRATVAMRHTTLTEGDPEMLGRRILSVAIRSCGGGHGGLLPFAEEAAVKPERNSWSGLRTPTWNVRQVNTAQVSTLE